MNKKIFTTGLISAIALSSFNAFADDAISANVTLATDYVWRGISQTDEEPTIQGGFDWASNNGQFYIGTWGSNVDFGGAENMELDVYAGWTREFSSGLGIDLGFIQYLYFDDPDNVDFNEFYAGLSFADVSGKVSHDFDNENTYVEVGYDLGLTDNLDLGLHVGRYLFDEGDNYTDYSIGLGTSYGGVDLGLTYHDTNISNVDIADDRFVFAISKAF